MSRFRNNSVIAQALMASLMLVTSAHALRTEPVEFHSTVWKFAPVNTGAYYSSEIPDFVLPAVIIEPAPRAQRLAQGALPVSNCEHSWPSPLHVRPPPGN